jgi:hypothetical protein
LSINASPRWQRFVGEREGWKAMAEGEKLVGLDEKVEIAGRTTTLREQYQSGKLHTMRRPSRSVGEDSFVHWALVRKDDGRRPEQFAVSEQDFLYLRGQVALPA